MFVNDRSKDKTWEIIQELARQDEHYVGCVPVRNHVPRTPFWPD